MENIIRVENLTKLYPERERDHTIWTSLGHYTGRRKRRYIRALNDISLEIRRGEILGIVGPNGAGKTTFLKVLAGLLIPERGEVTVDGYDILRERHHVRTSCNFLRSGGWVIFDYKYPIYKNLEFWGVILGVPLIECRKRIDEALEAVDLLGKRTDYPENLSAGMRQKLNLARCLLAPRPLFLLDEPTTNIDPFTSNFIRTYLKEHLGEMGITGILATHNLWEAEMMCDRIAILHEGRLLMIGTAEEIKAKVGMQSVLLKHPGLSEDVVKRIQALPFVTSVMRQGEAVKVMGDAIKENLPKILAIFGDIEGFRYIETQDQSFNDAFMELMKEQIHA